MFGEEERFVTLWLHFFPVDHDLAQPFAWDMLHMYAIFASFRCNLKPFILTHMCGKSAF
jgi:hypothetical protein